MNARTSFLGALLLAGGGAFALSAMDSRWIAVGWAVLVMLGFWGWVKLKLPDYADSQGFADDFYFLGFLLTLVALATALLRLGDLFGQAELLSTVLSQFGLALATTIVGLAGRTILLLDKEETEGTEERARRRVERAFDSLAQSLSRLSTEADVFSMQFGGKLREALTPVETTVSGFATAVAAIDDELKRVAGAVTELSVSVQGTTSRLSTAVSGLSEELETAGRRVRDELDTLGSGIRKAGIGVTQELSELVGVIEQVDTQSRDSVSQALHRLEQVADSIGGTGARVTQASEEVTGKLTGDLQAIATGLAELRTGVGQVVATMTSGGAELDETKRSWRSQIDELASVQRELAGQAKGTGRAVAEVRRDVADGVEQLVRALRELNH